MTAPSAPKDEQRQQATQELNKALDRKAGPIITVPEDPALTAQLLADDEAFGLWNPEQAKSGIKMILFGATGSGKSVMAGTFPNPIFIDLEGGMGSVMRNVARLPKDPRRVIEDMDQLRAAYANIKNHFAKPKPWGKTVVIDSLNELQQRIVDEILLKFPDNSRVYKTQLTRSDYGKLFYDFMKIFRLFLQLPCNVVFTVASTGGGDDFDESQKQFLLVGQATAPAIARLADMIGYVHTVPLKEGSMDIRHVVSFTNRPEYIGKDRLTSSVTHNRLFDNTYQAVFEPQQGKGRT